MNQKGRRKPTSAWYIPILRAEFRYLRKNNQESFWYLIRWERRARCRLGILVLYQTVEAERIHRSHYRR